MFGALLYTAHYYYWDTLQIDVTVNAWKRKLVYYYYSDHAALKVWQPHVLYLEHKDPISNTTSVPDHTQDDSKDIL